MGPTIPLHISTVASTQDRVIGDQETIESSHGMGSQETIESSHAIGKEEAIDSSHGVMTLGWQMIQ